MTREELEQLQAEPNWIPCRAQCGAQVFMATHERTGKPAPLLRPKEGGMEPNIAAWKDPGTGDWVYKILPRPSLDMDNTTLPGSGPQAEFLNHFADCPMAGRFRRRPAGDRSNVT